jgi:hypothetical protein
LSAYPSVSAILVDLGCVGDTFLGAVFGAIGRRAVLVPLQFTCWREDLDLKREPRLGAAAVVGATRWARPQLEDAEATIGRPSLSQLAGLDWNWYRLGNGHHNLAARAPFTDVSESCGNLLKRVGAINVDADLVRDIKVG